MPNRLSQLPVAWIPAACAETVLAFAVFAAIAGSARAQLQFVESGQAAFPPWFSTNAIVPGDFDGDGDVDCLSWMGPEPVNLLRNDGFGRFRVESPSPAPAIASPRIAVGDVDGDGDLDLVVAVGGGQNQLFLNDGTGAFTDATLGRMPVDADATRVIVLGDVDGDGDLDIVCGNQGQQSRLYLNSGLHSGVFVDATNSQMPLGSDATVDVALGDVDNDGDLDLVVCNGTEGVYQSKYLYQNRLYLNDGAGFFTDATATCLPAAIDPSSRVILGDVDEDGDLDLFVVEYGVWWYNSPTKYQPGSWSHHDYLNILLLNDGTGVFSASPVPLPAAVASAHDLVCLDVDGDDALDVVTIQGSSNGLFVNANDGSATFLNASSRMPSTYGATVFADIDGDRSADLLKVDSWDVRALRNRHAQLDAPLPLRVAQYFELDAFLCDFRSVGGVAIPALAFAPASIPLGALGTLGIDPGTAVGLPLIPVSPSTGAGALQMWIPNTQALVGLDVFAQALLLPLAGPPVLSNVVGDRLAADANLVVNGGFEQVTGAGTQVPVGWTSLSTCSILAVNSSLESMAGQRYVATRHNCTSASSSFYQDVPTTPGRSYVLSVGYGPTRYTADNHVLVAWNGGTVLDLQQDGTGVHRALWHVHRAVVAGVPGAGASRLTITDPGPPSSYGGNVDEVALVELDFRTAIQVTGEIVLDSVRFQPLRVLLQQAATAAVNNNLPAKAAALAAFVSAVNVLPANTILPEEAALLVAIAGAL